VLDEEGLRPLREPGEVGVETLAPENVPGVGEERPTGQRPESGAGTDIEYDSRPHPEGDAGTRGEGSGAADVRQPDVGGRPTGSGGIQRTESGNYRITDADLLEEGGAVGKYNRNIAAIRPYIFWVYGGIIYIISLFCVYITADSGFLTRGVSGKTHPGNIYYKKVRIKIFLFFWTFNGANMYLNTINIDMLDHMPGG